MTDQQALDDDDATLKENPSRSTLRMTLTITPANPGFVVLDFWPGHATGREIVFRWPVVAWAVETPRNLAVLNRNVAFPVTAQALPVALERGIIPELGYCGGDIGCDHALAVRAPDGSVHADGPGNYATEDDWLAEVREQLSEDALAACREIRAQRECTA